MRHRELLGSVGFGLLLAFLAGGTASAGLAVPPAPSDSSGLVFEKVLLVLTTQADGIAIAESATRRGLRMARRHERVVEELRRVADATQWPLIETLDELTRAGHIRSYCRFHVVNAVAVEATPFALDRLRSHPSVERVEPDLPIRLIDPIHTREETESRRGLDDPATPLGIRTIRAPDVWALGITGAGVLVSHFDTGVNGNHPALVSRWRGNNGYPASACWLDLVSGTNYPTDIYSHGTQTMGIICGLAPTDSIGVAWGAQYISARLNFVDGSHTISTALTAFQWLLDPDGNPQTFDDVPRVLSCSWGLEEAVFGCNTSFNQAIDNIEASGTAAFWACGNEGNSGSESIRAPANRAVSETNAFAVGAIDAYQDVIWSLSSLGPSVCTTDPNRRIKPEVVAPGVGIRSTGLGTSYVSGNGTSFSVPHAAGVAALLLEVNPELTPDSLKRILLLTAVDRGSAGNDNTYGYGRVDALTAVFGALSGIGWVSGRVTDASGFGVAAQIFFFEHPHTIATDNDGYFTFAMPAELPMTFVIDISGYLPFSQALVLSARDTLALDVMLQPSGDNGILTGTVIDCEGWPSPNAEVHVIEAGPGTTTNSQGRFHMLVPAGLQDLLASDGFCEDATVRDVHIAAGGITDIEIILPPNPQHLCSSPDPYGYRACDNLDPGGPAYAWQELVPSRGGKGVVHNMGDDYSVCLLLPFPVSFYGVSRQRIYFNSNGNASFVRSFLEYVNSPLPRRWTPTIFAMWTDLADNDGGDICSFHDPARGAFILEWSELSPYDDTTRQTFELVIYDPALYPTSTGDAVLDAYYNDLSVTTVNTVGLDANSGNNYLQYVYNGTYPEHASPLADGRALRFAAGQPLGGTPQLVLMEPSLSVLVPRGQWMDTSLTLQNLGSAPVAYQVKVLAGNLGRYDTLTSRMPGGPSYAFLNIAGIGQNTGIVNDDTTSDPILLPWPFKLYDRWFDRVGVCSNGYLSFTSCLNANFYQNNPLNDQHDPYYVVAPCWIDLNPAQGNGIFYYNDTAGDRFIVQWNQVPRYGQAFRNTFQAVLYHDGTVDMVYATVDSLRRVGTIGIKGRNANEVFQLARNQNFLQNNLLIRIARADTAAASCTLRDHVFGVLPAQAEQRVTLRLKNNGLGFSEFTIPIEIAHSQSSIPLMATTGIQSTVDSADVRLVIVPVAQGVRLHWDRVATPYYCIYSGAPGDPSLDDLEAVVSDTSVFLPYTPGSVRLFAVRLCDGPPGGVIMTTPPAGKTPQ